MEQERKQKENMEEQLNKAKDIMGMLKKENQSNKRLAQEAQIKGLKNDDEMQEELKRQRNILDAEKQRLATEQGRLELRAREIAVKEKEVAQSRQKLKDEEQSAKSKIAELQKSIEDRAEDIENTRKLLKQK